MTDSFIQHPLVTAALIFLTLLSLMGFIIGVRKILRSSSGLFLVQSSTLGLLILGTMSSVSVMSQVG
jgi:hypothetical protein